MKHCTWKMVYVALLVMTSFTMVDAFGPEKARITNCDGQELSAAAGQRIRICCQLSERECSATKEADMLTVAPRTLIRGTCVNGTIGCADRVANAVADRGWSIARTGLCRVRFEGASENSTHDQEVAFDCFKNDKFRPPSRVEKLRVLAKLPGPKILKIICSEKKDIIVIFNKNSSSSVQDHSTEYRVSMTEYDRVTDLCLTDCSLPQSPYSNICVCRYTNRDPFVNVFQDVNVTVTVNVSRPRQNNPITSGVTTDSINLYQHVRPGKVAELYCHNISATDALIIFRPSMHILYLVSSMSYYRKPLQYHVTLMKTQGLQEVFEIKLDKTVFNASHSNEYIGIRFRNLTAFTKYIFSVSGIGGGGRGSTSQIEFITNKTVPLHPPSIEDYSYMWKHKEGSSTLFLLWQPLPQESRGGELLNYDLQITFLNGSVYHERNINLNYKDISLNLLPLDAFTVKLWAVNEIGRSVNFSKIIIPSNHAAAQPSMYVEFENNSAHIYINLTTPNVIDMLAIHRCEGNKDICTEYPYTQIEQINQTNTAFPFLTFKMMMPTEKPTLRTYVKEFEHFEFKDKQKPLENAKIANGTITIGQVNLWPKEVDIFDEQSGLNVSSWIERELSGMPDKNEPIGHTFSNEITESTTVMYPRFFLSVKVKELWMGMVAADCYFDRKKDEAKLKVIPFDNNMYLRLSQECDNDMKPTQFLVDSYKIYSSDDELCKKASPEMNEMIEKRKMFSPTLFKLPETTSLGSCVVGLNRNRSRQSKAIFQHNSDFTAKGTETIPVIVIIAILTVFLVVILGFCLIKRCNNRRQHFHTITTLLNETDEREGEINDEMHDNELIHPYHTNNLTESGDSGHGTISSSDRDETETPEDIGLAEGTKLLHSPVESTSSSTDSEHVSFTECLDNAQVDETCLMHDEVPCSNHHSTSSSSDCWSKSTSSRKIKLNKYWKGGDLTFKPPTDDSSGSSTASGGGAFSESSCDNDNSTSGTN
ncbi:unnamed protein product [Lymnaea stagnalis]|uniref:Uncharacterized protein n=1 Tax=Lymnaea stagnalis TaxID=6523 RepID=A0AAV2I2U5_LYMST